MQWYILVSYIGINSNGKQVFGDCCYCIGEDPKQSMSLKEIKEDIMKDLRDEGIALQNPPTVQISVIEERLAKVLYPDSKKKEEQPTPEMERFSDPYEECFHNQKQ